MRIPSLRSFFPFFPRDTKKGCINLHLFPSFFKRVLLLSLQGNFLHTLTYCYYSFFISLQHLLVCLPLLSLGKEGIQGCQGSIPIEQYAFKIEDFNKLLVSLPYISLKEGIQNAHRRDTARLPTKYPYREYPYRDKRSTLLK